MKKILVYGAGAIGGYLGARLFQHGNDVTLLSLPEVIAPINKHGLTITEADDTTTVKPTAVATLTEAFANNQVYDLILVTLKSFDLDNAREAIAPYIAPSTVFLTMGNGIGVERPFIEQFGSARVIAGSLTTPISRANDHHLIVERPDRGVGLASTQADQDVSTWVNIFQQAQIPAIGFTDYESMKWSKALLNIVANASSAILNRSPAEVYRMPGMFDLEMRMLKETIAVMHAKGLRIIDLPGSPAAKLAFAVRWVPQFLLKSILTKIVASGRGDKMPSFYIDLVNGRGQSEVSYHNGAIAAAGQILGIATPVNALLNRILGVLTAEQTRRDEYDGNARRLVQEVLKT